MPLECVDDGDGDAGHFGGDAAEGCLGEECGGADLYGVEVGALGLDGREGEEGVGERGVCALGGEGNAARSAYKQVRRAALPRKYGWISGGACWESCVLPMPQERGRGCAALREPAPPA